MFNNPLVLLLFIKATCSCNERPPQIDRKYHTVQPGESLWKISRKYGIGLSELISANPQIQDPNLIYPNQVIVIPETYARR